MKNTRASIIKKAFLLPKGSSERRKILSSLKKTGGKWKKDPKVGKTYLIGYRSQKWVSTFLGWEIKGGEPYMRWKDAPSEELKPEYMEWEAYIYDGMVVVGSSADPLFVYGEA